jgi:choline dehydrogenase-like flavoprotein
MTYDIVLVGTGFASSFFLEKYLRYVPATARVLVVERGYREPRAWQLEEQRASRIDSASTYRTRGLARKEWRFTLGFGGGSNCWWGCVPRLLPADFELHTRYGVGDDWPVTYDDLVPYYEYVEAKMSVAGSADRAPYPRRGPHPQPPHRLTDPDRILEAAYPDQFFPQPAARARIPTGRQGRCCANGVCSLCPVNAKFTIEAGMSEIFDDPRVTVEFGADVRAVETAAGRATGCLVRTDTGERTVTGDLVVLGAGALFNAAILLRSGLPHPLLGRRLFEQLGVGVWIDLDGVDNFQGSTVITGNGYMLYDGPHRSHAAACLIETWNRPSHLRWEPGCERQLLQMKLLIEDLPEARNAVVLEDDEPVLHFEDYSDYAYRGVARAIDKLDEVLSPLPVERVVVDPEPVPTEGHLLGTVVMGSDPARSIVDRSLVHHEVRNLAVIGGSAFPTGSPANPTLTLSALAVWSADRLFGGAGR